MEFFGPLTLAVLAIFLLAGLVKGVIGLGLPTVAIGMLSLVMAPAEAAALLVVPSAVTNIWQMLAGKHLGGLVRRLWPAMAAIALGTWAGVAAGIGLAAGGDAARAAGALGIALILYAVTGLATARLSLPRGAEAWLGPLCGAATGAVTAATGVFVIPAVPYLQALALARDALVQALGLSFTVSTLALAAALAHGGAFDPSDSRLAGASLAALAAALAGMAAGQFVRTRISPAVFRLCFFLGLLALGGHLALRPFL